MKTNSDEDKQIDLFPVSKKEQNDLEKYVSSKQKAFNEAEEEKAKKERKAKLLKTELKKEKERRRKERIERDALFLKRKTNVAAFCAWECKQEQDRAKEYDLMFEIFNYIETNKLKIKPSVFKILKHKKPVDKEYGFILISITAPKFPKIRKNRDYSPMEKQFYRREFNLTQEKSLSMNSLALYFYGSFFDVVLNEGYMGFGGMGITRLIGGIKRHVVKTKAYTQMYGPEEEVFMNGPKGTYAFFEESVYRKDYFGDHSLEFKDNFSFDYDWTYPWYFTIFEDCIEEAGEELLKYFLNHGLEL